METNETAVDSIEETEAAFQSSEHSSGFENAKTFIADKLHKAAEAMGEEATDPDPDAQSGMARYGNRVSGWLDRSAEYVRQFDYEQADAGVREYVGRRPGRSFLIAGGVGLIIGAILRRR